MHTLRHVALLATLPALLGAGAVEVAARDGANLQRPVWSPDGKQLAFEANFHEKKVIELHVGDPSSRRFARVTPVARATSSLTAGFATRPDGGQVAHELSWAPPAIGRFVYVGATDAADYDLFVAGGGALAPHPAADGGPTWSPDGRHIAFTSSRTGQGDVYLLDVHAIEAPPRQLSRDAESSEVDVAWSPDGRSLVWVGHSDRGDTLWLLETLDGAPRALTRSGSHTRPAFAPTGDRIAFYAAEGDRFDLYVVPVTPGATPRRVAQDVVPSATGPAWTPDGRHLVYVRNDDARFDPVEAVTADGARRVPLDLGTVGNGDLDVVAGTSGGLRVAVVAQGLAKDPKRDFKRLFVADVPALP